MGSSVRKQRKTRKTAIREKGCSDFKILNQNGNIEQYNYLKMQVFFRKTNGIRTFLMSAFFWQRYDLIDCVRRILHEWVKNIIVS